LDDLDNSNGIAAIVVGFRPSHGEETHTQFGRFDKKAEGSNAARARIWLKAVLMASWIDRQLTSTKHCSKNSSWIL
jgi:hypothetical protein